MANLTRWWLAALEPSTSSRRFSRSVLRLCLLSTCAHPKPRSILVALPPACLRSRSNILAHCSASKRGSFLSLPLPESRNACLS